MTTSTPDREPTRQVATRYPDSIVARLDALATAERRDRSDVIRLLVEDGLPTREVAAGLRAEESVLPPVIAEAFRTSAARRRLSDADGHPYLPQSANPLRCETCGGKSGEHR